MKTIILTGLLIGVAFTLCAQESTLPLDALPTIRTEEGESLEDAVDRINAEVQSSVGVLSPKLLTKAALKEAIASAAKEMAESDIVGRESYANALTQITSTGRIPRTVHFCFSVFKVPYSQEYIAKNHDGHHLAISLNYMLMVPSNQGNQLIGLTKIVERFQVIKPQDQAMPFLPSIEELKSDSVKY